MAKKKQTKFDLNSRMLHALKILDRAEAKGDRKKVMEQRMKIKNLRAMMDDDFDYGKFNKGGVKKGDIMDFDSLLNSQLGKIMGITEKDRGKFEKTKKVKPKVKKIKKMNMGGVMKNRGGTFKGVY